MVTEETSDQVRGIAIFRIFDEAKAREFYIDWLGFKVDWEDRPEDQPIYMQISRGDLVLHLSEHHGDCCPGARLFVTMSRSAIDKYFDELTAKDYKYNKPGMGSAPWTDACFDVFDPFGNRLSFNATRP